MSNLEIIFRREYVLISKDGQFMVDNALGLIIKEKNDMWDCKGLLLTTEEKDIVLDTISSKYNYNKDNLKEYTIETNMVIKEQLHSEEYLKEKLTEEVNEFLNEIDNNEFGKEKAIDEAWDVWTNLSSLLHYKGVSMDEFMEGFKKNMDKKIARGFRYECK